MRFLVIQTAFLGDVILVTPVIEKLRHFFPDAEIDLLVRKGNEGIIAGHPYIHELFIWDKKKNKYKNLFALIRRFRSRNYDHIFNFQRFAGSGLITVLSGAKKTSGFKKNPFSFLFSHAYEHEISAKGTRHEIERNLQLIEPITDKSRFRPALYPSVQDFQHTAKFKEQLYICMAPASVWFTKQLPKEKWIELSGKLNGYAQFLIGSAKDAALCEEIAKASGGRAVNLAGRLTLLETVALIKDATMNYVNDSAPMHMASAMNAPVTAFYCSTVPGFGFGPLSDLSAVKETAIALSCRPCGLHGYSGCPLGHFRCATTIVIDNILPPIRLSN